MNSISKQFLAGIFCILFLNIYGQSTIDKEYVKNSLTHLFDKYHIPDASIIVNENGKEIFRLDKNIENTNKNYFIGSCSKSFTALATLKLVDAGKIELDKTVRGYLPWFELKNKEESKNITIRHLLNQTSGMKTSDGFFDLLTSDQGKFEKEFSVYLSNAELLYKPGSTFNYCNSNYMLLGLIIAKVSQQSYDSYLEEQIFSKIGMQNTYASYEKGIESNMVVGYQDWFHLFKSSKKYEYSNFFVPTGLITSNSDDLAKYLNCLLNKSITHKGDTLLSPNSSRLLITTNSKGYAMGWMTDAIIYNDNFRKQYDIPFIFHTGSVNSYISALAIYQEKNITISTLSNTNSFEFSKEALNVILASANNSTYKLISSKERLFKNGVLIIIIVVFMNFLNNLRRWSKNNFKFNFTSDKYVITRLVIGLILSIAVLFLAKLLYNIPLGTLIDYQPDFGYSFLFISVIGIVSSIIQFFSPKYEAVNTLDYFKQ